MAPKMRKLSSRPQGKVGSAHHSRESLGEKYERAALMRTAAWIFLWLTFPVVLLKLLWHLIPLITDGSDMFAWGPGIFVGDIICLIVWKLARPATPQESLVLVKVTGAINVILLSLHMTTMFRYHVTLPKQLLLPRRLHKFLGDRHGLASVAWRHTFTTVEAGLDSLQFVMQMGASWCLHQYIMDVMKSEKERQEKDQKKDE